MRQKEVVIRRECVFCEGAENVHNFGSVSRISCSLPRVFLSFVFLCVPLAFNPPRLQVTKSPTTKFPRLQACKPPSLRASELPSFQACILLIKRSRPLSKVSGMREAMLQNAMKCTNARSMARGKSASQVVSRKKCTNSYFRLFRSLAIS